jgi:hypothetical protein
MRLTPTGFLKFQEHLRYVRSLSAAVHRWAEAFLRDMAGERFEAMSAGAEATTLDPEAVAAIDEVGPDISGQTDTEERRPVPTRTGYLSRHALPPEIG